LAVDHLFDKMQVHVYNTGFLLYIIQMSHRPVNHFHLLTFSLIRLK